MNGQLLLQELLLIASVKAKMISVEDWCMLGQECAPCEQEPVSFRSKSFSFHSAMLLTACYTLQVRYHTVRVFNGC